MAAGCRRREGSTDDRQAMKNEHPQRTLLDKYWRNLGPGKAESCLAIPPHRKGLAYIYTYTGRALQAPEMLS